MVRDVLLVMIARCMRTLIVNASLALMLSAVLLLFFGAIAAVDVCLRLVLLSLTGEGDVAVEGREDRRRNLCGANLATVDALAFSLGYEPRPLVEAPTDLPPASRPLHFLLCSHQHHADHGTRVRHLVTISVMLSVREEPPPKRQS